MIIHNGGALDKQNDGNPQHRKTEVCHYVNLIFTIAINDATP